MTETIDSNKQQLTLPEIVMHALQRAGETGGLPQGVDFKTALIAVSAEMSMPNTDVKRVRNTVFVSHFSSDKTETSTRAFNMDSARNFVENSIQYTTGLANSGVKRMTVDFKDNAIKQMLLMVAKSPIAVKYWGMQIFKTSDGGYRAFINFNEAGQ